MKAFIIYQTYRVIDSKPYIFLFGRLENNQSFLTINHYEPYFYIKTSDIKHLPKEYQYENTNFKNFNNEKVSRILAELPSNVPKIRKELDIDCYEADIRFPQRYLLDKNIKSTINIEGDYELGSTMDRIYQEPEITPIKYSPTNLKVFSIDIETSSNLENIYSISIYSDDFEKSLIISNKKLDFALNFKDEESLLEEFRSIIIEEDPDILTGWNFIDFDLKYLQDKFKQYKIPFILGRVDKPCKLKLESNFFRTSKADFQGRVVLDGIDLLKGSFIKLPDYKLNTASHHFLKERKLLPDFNKGAQLDNLFKTNQKRLIQYNLKDAKLALNILKKSNVLNLTIHRSLLTGMPLDRVNASIASFDSLYLRKLKQKKYVAPSSSFGTKEAPIKGGYVMESKPGIYENIIILDFKSLYPSIIRTFNIDPLSFLGKKKTKNSIKTSNNVYFKNEKGILPEIIRELMEEREKVKKDELTSYAIKILLNSFFGVTANPFFRFFNTDLSNAITHSGQELIKLTAKKIKEQGYEVIYQDTDSIFINSKLKDSKKAEDLGISLAKKINKFFNTYIQKKYNRESCLELEFEKVFLSFLMPKVRGLETGAKKRYAGLIIKDGKEKIEFTGMESRRRDWTEAAQKFQGELLNLIFHKKEINTFVKNFIESIRKGKHDDWLIYRKSIRKDLSSYQVKSQHVKAARKLKVLDSNMIEYLITTDGPEPIQLKKHKINYDHYIEKQIKPIANQVLILFDKDFDDIIKGSKQTTLF